MTVYSAFYYLEHCSPDLDEQKSISRRVQIVSGIGILFCSREAVDIVVTYRYGGFGWLHRGVHEPTVPRAHAAGLEL